jgi:hypothetical protein
MFGDDAERYNVIGGEVTAALSGGQAQWEEIYGKLSRGGGRASADAMNAAAMKKTLNDTIKGTAYNVGRSLEAFYSSYVGNTEETTQLEADMLQQLGLSVTSKSPRARREAANRAAEIMRSPEAYPRARTVNQAVTSLSRIYQPGLDLLVGLGEGLTGFESILGSANLRDQGGGAWQIKARLSGGLEAGNPALGAQKVADQSVLWSTKTAGGINTLKKLANAIPDRSEVSNELIAWGFATGPESYEKIYSALEQTREGTYSTLGLSGDDLEKQYRSGRRATLNKLIDEGTINMSGTLPRAIVAKAAFNFAKQNPTLAATAQVPHWSGKAMSVQDYLLQPEVGLGLLNEAVMTGNIGDIADFMGFLGMSQALTGVRHGQSQITDLSKHLFDTFQA